MEPSNECPVDHTAAAGQCPVRHGFTMMDETFLAEPYAVFREVREQPVFYSDDLDVFVVTRAEDIEAILTSPDKFSNTNTLTPLTKPSQEAMAILEEADYFRPPNLINADGERHKTIRGYVQEAMSPRRLRALEPIVRDWSAEQIERMSKMDQADIVAELGFPLPALTGLSLLGFPREDLELLKSWCYDRVEFTYGRATTAEQVRVATNVAAFWKYTNDFVADRMENPVDDLASDLVRRHFEKPDYFTPRDIATVLFEMAVASHETTTNLISNGLRRLLESRGQWEELVEDQSLIPNAVEECLRYDGGVVGWRRRAVEAVEVGGVTVPAEATTLILLASANRDPRKFERPETFDIHRPEARKHVTFGKGVHFCQGAPLARMEARVIFELLTEMTPQIKLVPGQEFSFVPNILLRGPSKLLIDFSEVPAAVAAPA
jgi:cytochrome P450